MTRVRPPQETDHPSAATGLGLPVLKRRRRPSPGWGLCAPLILVVLLPPLLFSAPLPAREESASLVFRQTASPSGTRVYVVKKGEWLSAIIQSQLGMEKIPYALIRRLNPQIRNLNRIYPGQRIHLPLRENAGDPAHPPLKVPAAAQSPAAEAYRIQPGDSLGRIILEALDISPDDVLPTYSRIRRLNPALTDPQNLPPGELLTLPPGLARRKPEPPPALSTPVPTAEKALPAITKGPPPTGEGWLAIIRPVLAKMNGTLLSRGNYVIPLQEGAQLNIDCATLPVVELDDGTTILLDFRGLLSETVQRLLHRSWPTHHVLGADQLGDALACLKGIFARSKTYTLVRNESPLRLSTIPEILFYPDWTIRTRENSDRTPYRQALLLLAGQDQPLPGEATSFLERSGLFVTEITGAAVLPATAAVSPVLPRAATVDPGDIRGIALAERLLSALGITPRRQIELPIFDQVRDGFRLSITADLLVERGSQKVLLHSKRLPEQFIGILNQSGTTYIFCDPQQGGRTSLEGLLAGLDIPFSFGHFSFQIPEANVHPRLTVSFSGLRTITGAEPFYLIDFPLPPGVETLFSQRRWGRTFRY